MLRRPGPLLKGRCNAIGVDARARGAHGVMACVMACVALFPPGAQSADASALLAARAPALAGKDYPLGPGDLIRVSVFQNPDLSLDARISENGTITYPLIGEVAIGGMSIQLAEKTIARLLQQGRFLIDPQVTILIQQVRGNQVAALGYFARPGRYPLDTASTRLSDLLALAGGTLPAGSDTVFVTGVRDGQKFRREVDVPKLLMGARPDDDILLQAGDILYNEKGPTFYVHGEVQRPGVYRVERDMNFAQALVTAGGISLRGTTSGFRVKRRDAAGALVEIRPRLDDMVRPDDLIFFRESFF